MAILGIDVGGTFTDAVLIHEDGSVETAKVPTAERHEESVVAAARAVGARDVTRFAHGTTAATNALIERRGARTAFVTTAGFEHLLHLRRQNRAHLYRLCAAHPEPLVPLERCHGVAERTGPEGVIAELGAIPNVDAEAIAVCLLFSFRHPGHEQAVAEELRRRHPAAHVVASHELAPEFREYERASTTVVDAYLGPLVAASLGALREAAAHAGLPEPLVMTSSGGLLPLTEAAAHAARVVLSGPAAGVVGAARVASAAGFEAAISFDMGGTSTDVALVSARQAGRSAERDVAGVPLRLPTVDVHTVGAGGGSIARRDAAGALHVGPRSAGSRPGPACYGRGGTEPTVTDANLMLGRLPPTLASGLELGADAAARALGSIDPADVIAVVNAEMERALRVVTVERGHDPRELALVAFGGAGPLHACALAEELEVPAVLVPRAAGVLSALGLAAGDVRREHVRSHVVPLGEAGELPAEGEADLRYRGQSFELTVPLGLDLPAAFHAAHEERYGYADAAREIELVAVRTAEVDPGPPVELVAGAHVSATGPGLVELEGATCWVPAGWSGETDDHGTLVPPAMSVELQVLGSALRAVAEEMGAVLVRSAFSANIKERRDCSTALFDERGRLVAQVEHIPVHLGAMPDAVAAVIEHDPRPGETWILNDPYAGGTHLPDVTTVSRTELGFAATRAHHADVGGVEPGSMPAGSHTLAEEGVVIPPTRLEDATLEELVARMRNPDERRGDLRAQLAANRLAERRVAELCARKGAARLRDASAALLRDSETLVRAAIACIPDGRYEAEDVLEARDGLLAIRCAVTVAGDAVEIDFAGSAPEHGGNLNCPLSVTRSACFFVVRCLTEPDLPASGGAFAPVSVRAPAGSLVNARPPRAVAAGNVETSCRIVDVVMRAFGAAVPVPAQGQGTMNNVTLGNDRFTYYETIGGGQGACPDADGPSAVHVTMSNTLATPVEALELGYPIRVERWALRLGSGGAGRHRGGDGVVRELRVLEDCRLSVVAERRERAPAGAVGGAPGETGRNLLNGEPLPAKADVTLGAGDLVTIETPGGGGRGQ